MSSSMQQLAREALRLLPVPGRSLVPDMALRRLQERLLELARGTGRPAEVVSLAKDFADTFGAPSLALGFLAPGDTPEKGVLAIVTALRRRFQMAEQGRLARPLFDRVVFPAVYRSRTDLVGEAQVLCGPAVLAVSHHLVVENAIIQSVVREPIWWLADPRLWLGPWSFRYLDVPLLGNLMRRLGAVEVDRARPGWRVATAIGECVRLLERGRLVGVMVAGGTDREVGVPGRGTSGISTLVRRAIKAYGTAVRVVPVGVGRSGRRLVVRLGTPVEVRTLPREESGGFSKLIAAEVEKLSYVSADL